MKYPVDRSERVELTTLCLLTCGGQVLLQNRVKNDWRGYALPGGHVEPGESIVESVIREMKEETGLTVPHPQLCGIKQFPIDGGRYIVFLFKADSFSGTLTASEEGRVEWVPLEALGAYDTVEDLALLIDVMLSNELTEFQYVIREGSWEALIR